MNKEILKDKLKIFLILTIKDEVVEFRRAFKLLLEK